MQFISYYQRHVKSHKQGYTTCVIKSHHYDTIIRCTCNDVSAPALHDNVWENKTSSANFENEALYTSFNGKMHEPFYKI